MELNRRMFLVLTFIIIVIIMMVTDDMTQAMLFITLMTQYLILSHYLMVSVKEVSDEPQDARIQALVDKRVAEQQAAQATQNNEKFTGFYIGAKPQFGNGAGLEVDPADIDFKLESLDDKYQVLSDDGVDHTPEIPPLNTDPEQYMDIDDKNSFMAQTRQRDRRALDGRVLANRDHFAKYYENELGEQEKSRWWGNRDYEETVAYGDQFARAGKL